MSADATHIQCQCGPCVTALQRTRAVPVWVARDKGCDLCNESWKTFIEEPHPVKRRRVSDGSHQQCDGFGGHRCWDLTIPEDLFESVFGDMDPGEVRRATVVVRVEVEA